jgi:hypothetical protein
MRVGLGMALLMGILALLACGNSSMSSGSGGGPGGPMFDARGNWQITTQSQSGASGGAAASFQQNLTNGTLTGSLSSIQPPCASSATLMGSINQNKIQFAAMENGQAVNFMGTTTATGGMSGTYTSAAGGCTNGDSGTWSAARTSR